LKTAIIGTGIAGMGCGHFLYQEDDLTFYEQNNYIGGHTNTVIVDEDGKPIYIDTGFMVKNIFNISYLKMLSQIARFNKESVKILDDPKYADYSLGRYRKR